MATAAEEHARTVLSAIIPDRKDRLDVALGQLSPEHFVGSEYRNMFKMLRHVAEITNSVMTVAMMREGFKGARADAGKIAHYESLYDLFVSIDVADADFLWSLNQLKELLAARATEEALTVGMQALKHGVADSKGVELIGHESARSLVLDKFADIDRNLSKQEAPEGNILEEGQNFLESYKERKRQRLSGETSGILFGIPDLDQVISGFQRGELNLIVGSSSSGKTSMVCALAWWACIMQQKNVVYFTSESLREQVQRKIVARHSKMGKFGCPNGLDTRSLKHGSLSDEEEIVLNNVIRDFNSKQGYGVFQLAQIPRGATLSVIESGLRRYSRDFEVDLCIIDYLNLLHPDRRRGTDLEEKNDLLKSSKQLAYSFNAGQGVPIVSPWQVNREAKKRAAISRYYDDSALAETSEATKSSDVIITILEPENNVNRHATLTAQVLKNRDGLKASDIQIDVDYATCYFDSKSGSSMSMSSLLAI